MLKSNRFKVAPSGNLVIIESVPRWVLQLFVFISLFVSNLHADPESILIEGYTFFRPQPWKWEAEGRGSAVNRFLISDTTDVRFYIFPQTEKEIKERLLGNFEKNALSKTDSVKAGDATLTYVTIWGKPAEKLNKGKMPLKVVGVCLRTSQPKKQILVRLYGPPDEVDAATSQFKQMVEKAVEESGK